MTRGTLSKLSGVSSRTIRFYEEKGFIPLHAKRDNGYRDYDSTAVEQLKYIKNAQRLGFSLKEIKELSEMKIAPGSSCETVHKKAMQKIRDIEQRIAELNRIMNALKKFTTFCSPGKSVDECRFLQLLEKSEDNPDYTAGQ